MAERAILQLVGCQRDEAGVENVTQIRVGADYYERNGSCYILYEEKQEKTEEITKNIIKYKESVLEITKRGSVYSHMVFEVGQTHKTDYITPYGTLCLEVSTQKAEFLQSEHGIEIHLSYTLTFDESFLSDCALAIRLEFSKK